MKHADPRVLEGLHALVVDDNAVNRRILRDMLVNWRMHPAVVESGAAALQEMLRAAKANEAYQLVLLDAMMPEMDGLALAEKIREQSSLKNATVMMLSSAMPSGTAARCTALGIAGLLTKPVTQSDLLDAILLALGADQTLEDARHLESGAGEILSRPALRILIAEDNLINRAVATGILEKHGHSLAHASNGREAVAAVDGAAFDLIFMDVQMPEMDGFEATRAIRELQATTGLHTPIVAMTAHAMAGDRERCLTAGMDDYITKPVRKEDLLRVLENWSDAAATRVPEPLAALPPHGTGSVSSLYTREELLEQCDGDGELMGALISLFNKNTPQIMDAIRAAIVQPDASALTRGAHKLLSSFGAFGAQRALALAVCLEEQGQRDDLDGAQEMFAKLEREIDKIYAALAAFAVV